jgi:hypothetical protein
LQNNRKIMKKIAYQLIFGESWGTGHINRAIAFKSNIQNPTDIYVILESRGDQKYLERYRTPCTTKSLDYRENFYDLVIDDTLGLFSKRTQGFGEAWILDAVQLNKTATQLNRAMKNWSILYPSSGPPFLHPEIFFKKDVPCCAIFQGGGDDHFQLQKIIEKLPADHNLIVGVGSNCRHVLDLQRSCAARGKANVMIDFDVRRIARAADYIITSGGNILYELYHLTASKNIILYSKELKEHLTFSQYSTSKRVVRCFSFDEEFEYEERFATNNQIISNSKKSLEEFGLI